ncbi:hypothetical protein GOV14_03025 [Candidatus Pacearchaeota archaeon]|nr:hypothetical protein [Candidatus Pacearchaeota archaeon]
MKYGIKIETFKSAGRYQHTVYEIGVKPDRVGELSNDVVEAQKRVNEKVYEEMPENATGLVAIIKYKAPKKK